jgi:predicted Zn-dependent protease
MPPCKWPELDAAPIARLLSQIAEQPEDLADAFFERREEVELAPEGERPRLRVQREEGFAVRLMRGGRSWLAARDGFDGEQFAEALRQVARALPSASYPAPELRSAPPALDLAREVLDFPALVLRAVRAQHVGFALRLTVRRHRRSLQVVGPRLVPGGERETFYSCTVDTEWGRRGALLVRLDAGGAARVAASVVALFRARHAAPPEPFRGVAVLGPEAVAVLLHEAVAHALEADLLAQGGDPAAAAGVAMGAACLDVLDDPGAAPEEVRRATDDEGQAVVRRWLLRGGLVEQPLADAAWARASPALLPGAGRRAGRHHLPCPRSSHLELLPGEAAEADLLAGGDGGLYLPEASRGSLDPLSGELSLRFPYGFRLRRRGAAEPVGPCTLRGRVAELLDKVAAVGRETRSAGAGWCAKKGQKLPVWATAPTLRLEGVDLTP